MHDVRSQVDFILRFSSSPKKKLPFVLNLDSTITLTITSISLVWIVVAYSQYQFQSISTTYRCFKAFQAFHIILMVFIHLVSLWWSNSFHSILVFEFVCPYFFHFYVFLIFIKNFSFHFLLSFYSTILNPEQQQHLQQKKRIQKLTGTLIMNMSLRSEQMHCIQAKQKKEAAFSATISFAVCLLADKVCFFSYNVKQCCFCW